MTYYLSKSDNMVYDFSHIPSGNDWEKLSNVKGKQSQQAQALEQLSNIFNSTPWDDSVYAVLRHVSSSGMSRNIDFYVIRDNQPRYITGLIAQALDYKLSKNGGLTVGGCGMDMGFHVIYTLSSMLYKSDGSIGSYKLTNKWI